MAFVILIGASGAGKTTIARAIAERHADEVAVFYFDQIGVPSVEDMVAECGSGKAWQRANTIEWMARLAPVARSGRAVLFEGQTRLAFLAEGAALAGGIEYWPILIDCDDETRVRRLTAERKQPALADETMMNWARYLRSEAKRSGCEILDTGALPLERCIIQVMGRLRGAEPSKVMP